MADSGAGHHQPTSLRAGVGSSGKKNAESYPLRFTARTLDDHLQQLLLSD